MKRVHRPALTVLALVCALAFAAGCGNGEQNDYVDEVNALQTELSTSLTEAGSNIDPANPKSAVAAIGTMQEAFTNAADELEAVDPPEEVADTHAQLVETLRGIGDQIATVEESLGSGNPQAMVAALTEMQTSVTQAQTELSSLVDEINAEFGN
jgi:predicted  nucleic acid-binding Zn-ribbon protein